MSRNLRARTVLGTASLLLAVGLAGCGSEEGEGAAPQSAPSPAATADTSPVADPPDPAAPPADTVPKALDFTATTVGGKDFDGGTLVGKPTVLWFWAPWCPVCRSQGPDVEKLASTFGDRLNVVGVGSLDSGSAIEDFAEDVEGPTHLSDPDGAIWKRFRIAEQSSFVVLDASGREVLRTGYDDDDEVAGAVKKLLG